jgi:sn-glycerol 3-phosphate transport system substrate-binding protein
MGRYTKSEDAFSEGKIAFLLQGANRYSIIKRKANFDIGVLPVPYWKRFTSSPYNINIGGSSFWVLKKKSNQNKKEIAKFLSYLSSEKVQAHWHILSGYLPITQSAYRYCINRELYSSNPAARVAVEQMFNRDRGSYTFGVRVRAYPKIRERIVDFLEEIFLEGKAPKEALEEASIEASRLLESEYK